MRLLGQTQHGVYDQSDNIDPVLLDRYYGVLRDSEDDSSDPDPELDHESDTDAEPEPNIESDSDSDSDTSESDPNSGGESVA